MDPQRSNAVWIALLLWGNVTEALVTTDGQGVVIPELAESVELMADGVTWRFKLRQGISFHNGEPFNAEAVKFSLDRISGEEFGALIIGYFKDYFSTTVVDEFTVDVVTSQPSPRFPGRLDLGPDAAAGVHRQRSSCAERPPHGHRSIHIHIEVG